MQRECDEQGWNQAIAWLIESTEIKRRESTDLSANMCGTMHPDKPQMSAYVHSCILNEEDYIKKNSEDKLSVIKHRILDPGKLLSDQNVILDFIVLHSCIWLITGLVEINACLWLCLSLRSTDISVFSKEATNVSRIHMSLSYIQQTLNSQGSRSVKQT